MPDPVAPSLPIDRAALGRVFKDFRTLVAIEQALQASLNSLPAQIADLLVTALVLATADPQLPNARVLTGSPGVTIDTATAGQIKVLVNVATALGYTPANAADDFVTFAAPSGDLTGARQLSGGTGVTVDVATAGLAKVVVDALAILNALATIGFTKTVNAGAGLNVSGGGLNAVAGALVSGGLECDSLRVDAIPAATATASDHSIPINCNGTTYYMRLSTAP